MIDLRNQWERVAKTAANNPEVRAPMPRKWGVTRDHALALIDEYIDGNWEELINAVRLASNGGAGTPLTLSLSRLTSKGCSRLDDLLCGVWAGQGTTAVDELRARRDEIQATIDHSTKSYGRHSDSLDSELRSVNNKLKKLGG